MNKNTHIISELNTFFHKNDCNKAINCIMTTIRHFNLRSSCIGVEKRHNCKLSCLQVLELLLVFPFFMVKNSFQYHHSGLSKFFSCQKDMFYRFMEQDNIDWRKLVYLVSIRLLNRISSRKDSKESLQCLIIDDTDLPKTGFKTEMIGRIYSHVLHKSVLGFKGLYTGLNFFEAYRIYSMRWAIEVCFSEMKGLLKLGKCQCLNFSSQIASISLTVMQYNILSFIKRFEAYETIGGLFNQTINGTMELSVTERIWDLVLQIVSAIADLFSADEEEIIRMIANDNQKIAIIKKLCPEKKTE